MLTRRELKAIEKAEQTVQPHDLYKALHLIGDDPVKTAIEDALQEVLDEPTYRKVVAVFKVATEEE